MKRGLLVLVAALVAGLIMLVHALYRADLRQAHERIAAGAQLLETPCGPIEYARVGSGPAVLLVHGAGGGFDQGLLILGELAGQGFQVIAVSRFGYLGTPLPADASAAAQGDAHACLLDGLGIDRALVIGASAGAPSSMQFALRHPERTRALVLLVPAAYVPRPGDAPSLITPPGTAFLFDTALRSDFLFWAAPRLAPGWVAQAILATPPEVIQQASAEERARVARIQDQILPVRPRRLGLINDAAITSVLPRYDLERLRAPTLVVSAEDDLFGTIDGARYTAEQLPDARFIGYPSGGHLWVGHHDALITALVAFLRDAPR